MQNLNGFTEEQIAALLLAHEAEQEAVYWRMLAKNTTQESACTHTKEGQDEENNSS